MGRKGKVDFIIKSNIVHAYLNGDYSLREAGRIAGVSFSTIKVWLGKYQMFGESGLKNTSKNNRYSSELKQMAVKDYLDGDGSLIDISQKYGLRSKSQLENWIIKYTSNEVLKSSKTGGITIMRTGRKTTYDERIEIVKYCIEHENNYTETAQKFHVSYQQVYSWLKKYESKGVEALKDKRGKRKLESEMTELEKLKAQNKLLSAENTKKQMEIDFLKKVRGNRNEAVLSSVRYESIYLSIQELHDALYYPIKELCDYANIQRSSYYKWIKRKESRNEILNKQLLPLILNAYEEKGGILGYRQMTIKINRETEFTVNHKRIYRLMKILKIKSVCRKKRKIYIKSTPQITAENILNREFTTDKFGEKWLTDVTEMKYGIDKKIYLSAILDLGDKSIVSFVVGKSNNNNLVFKTFDIAHKNFPTVKPIFHSDYTEENTIPKILQKPNLTELFAKSSV